MRKVHDKFNYILCGMVFCGIAISTTPGCGGDDPVEGSGTSSSSSSSGSSSSSASSSNGSISETLVIEENALGYCTIGGVIESDHSGYQGTGYFNSDNFLGSAAQWNVISSGSGQYELSWRYGNGTTNARSAAVFVNDVKVASLPFNGDGSWSSWQTERITVTLESGENLIRLEAESADGLVNIDNFSAAGQYTLLAAECPVPEPVEGCEGGSGTGRFVECLDRGVVAHQQGDNAFVSWRLLGYDAPDTGFNLYRQLPGGSPQLVCSQEASDPTWCLDPNEAGDAEYFVRTVNDGVEGEPSGAAPLLPRHWIEIPLRPAAGAHVHLGWVGDLTGDGEYDVVVDRISGRAPLVDAYTRKGEFLWRLDTGPNGENQNNIEGGSTVISNGHNDGLTVFDFDSDGRAEVAIKTANGFIFGDGQRLNHGNDIDQFVSIVDGRTGAEKARTRMPGDFIPDGPLQCQFGVGYLDGVNPSVVTKCKNRVGSGGFNLVVSTYDYDGAQLRMRWKYIRNGGPRPDFHQIRVMDVDGDGMDEVLDGGYVLDQDGTVLYDLGQDGVVHGDRFHVTDIDPSRPGLEGFAIQQDNRNGLETYYYDAATGNILRKYFNPGGGVGGDMGRGTVADVFPDVLGMEYWSFNGLYSAAGDLLVPDVNRNVPWPNFHMHWDGDLGSELLDQNRVGDWDINARERNTYSWRESFDGLVQARGALPFYGDILGDWREEVIIEASDNSHLKIYTTGYQTDVRLYTLPHNPAYRNSMTVNGYKQSHHVDYYLGEGMAPPPAPAIRPAPRQ